MQTKRVAFDLDGVIDRYPESIRWLSNLLLHSGHEIYIITGRPNDRDWDRTLLQLKKHKIRFTELHMYPGTYAWDGTPLSNEVQQGIGEWKASMCEELGIDLFFDDNLHAYRVEFSCGLVHV